MAYRFTEEQQAAIDTRDRTLLVSAAAGSGKTATLTGRIIASLTDKKNPTSLSRIVVSTFTNDSAADMRKKIAAALAAALEKDPDNETLAREQLLQSSARILTIDSFCLRLLRRHADAVGLPATFRVADAAEGALLGAQVMEELIEELYGGEVDGVTPDELCLLSDTLTSAKSEGDLAELLLSLYEDVLHDVRGVAALRDAADGYRESAGKPFFETPYGIEIADYYAAAFEDLATAFAELIAFLEGGQESSLAKRLPFCCEEKEYLLSLASLLRARDAAIPSAVHELPTIPGVRGEVSEENRRLGDLHTEARELLCELKSTYLTYREDELSVLLVRLGDFSELLYRVLSLYDARLMAEKRRRGILGFLDIERATYALLVEGGEPTPLARELAAGIDTVYIDEFQDVNALQYGIYRAIAREDNLFMVGDAKQCIYAFRHADPSIFTHLRATYPPLSEEKTTAASHSFSRNFRCDRPIVRYVNRVAGRLLAAAGGGAYTAADDLVFAKDRDVGEEPVETHVFELPTRSTKNPLSEEAFAILSTQECAWVAEKIEWLLKNGRKNDGTPIRPGDITLLFRTSTKMPLFAAALSGVAPVIVDDGGDFFLNPEVLLALSLLYTIDNPRRDIYLAAALRSPVFGMTLSELTAIRSENRMAPSLFDAVLAYCEAHSDFEKGKRFLSLLADWRRMAEGESVGELLLAVFRDAGLLTLGGEGSTRHHDNLYRLYQYARSFEVSSYQGLYSFISYVNTAIENRTKLLKPAAEGKEDAVRFMTIHKSKGLEFPVVFLCDTQHGFNRDDLKPTLLYDRRYGPVVRLLNEGGRTVANNPIRDLVHARKGREQTAEEIRLLYVALTRARERLYVTGAVTKPEEKVAKADLMMRLMKDWYILSHNNTLAWILPLLASTSDPYLRIHLLSEGDGPIGKERSGQTAATPPPASSASVTELADLLRARLTFTYPDRGLTLLPEKLSVSRLSPTVLDGSDEAVVSPVLPGEHRPTVPYFLSGQREDEAALAGTATHLFMQFCDHSRLMREGVEAELAHLVAAEFLRPEEAARVRLDEIEAFRRSPLFARMLAAKALRRELRFHALLPAADFTEDRERAALLGGAPLLVQGVIDCILEEEDGYLIIDYKTDRLTPAELASKPAAAAKLLARHRTQLAYYAAACKKMYGTPPKEVLLYSLPLSQTIDVPLAGGSLCD